MMKMQLLSCLVLLWVTFTQTTSAFRPATRPAALRQPSHCHAKKPASRGSQATQSFAVSVESSAEPAVDDPPYLETGASSLVHPVSFVPDLANMEPEDYQKILHKVLNGIILTVAFGSAIYAILNIDAGMTRGWTQQEIAMRIPLDTWSSYENSLEEQPIVTKTIINVVIYLLGDWLSQTAFSKKNVLDFDALRTLRNGFIGLCFGPLVVYYYQFSDFILPPSAITNRIAKIFMDQTIYLTVKCSLYIMAVAVLQGDSLETAAQNVKDKIKNILFTAWKFWPLVHCITYSVIPAQHRILWVNMVDLVWNAILATLNSQKTEPTEVSEALALQGDLSHGSEPEDVDSLVPIGEQGLILQRVDLAAVGDAETSNDNKLS